MKQNTQHNHRRTTRMIKGLLASLLIASVAIASPAAASTAPTTVQTSASTSVNLGGGYQVQVAWGGCGGNCGQ